MFGDGNPNDPRSFDEERKLALKRNALRLKLLANQRGTYAFCDSCKTARYLPAEKDPEKIPSRWACAEIGMSCNDPQQDFSELDPTYDAANGVLVEAKYTVGTVVWVKDVEVIVPDHRGGLPGIIDDDVWSNDSQTLDCRWPPDYRGDSRRGTKAPKYFVTLFDSKFTGTWVAESRLTPWNQRQALSTPPRAVTAERKRAVAMANAAAAMPIQERRLVYTSVELTPEFKRIKVDVAGLLRPGQFVLTTNRCLKDPTRDPMFADRVIDESPACSQEVPAEKPSSGKSKAARKQPPTAGPRGAAADDDGVQKGDGSSRRREEATRESGPPVTKANDAREVAAKKRTRAAEDDEEDEEVDENAPPAVPGTDGLRDTIDDGPGPPHQEQLVPADPGESKRAKRDGQVEQQQQQGTAGENEDSSDDEGGEPAPPPRQQTRRLVLSQPTGGATASFSWPTGPVFADYAAKKKTAEDEDPAPPVTGKTSSQPTAGRDGAGPSGVGRSSLGALKDFFASGSTSRQGLSRSTLASQQINRSANTTLSSPNNSFSQLSRGGASNRSASYFADVSTGDADDSVGSLLSQQSSSNSSSLGSLFTPEGVVLELADDSEFV